MKTDEKSQGLIKYEFQDGYETGGLLYFRFEGREMVAVIRERSQFDQHQQCGTSLQGYIDTNVSNEVYGAGLALDELIPVKKLH